MNAPNRLTLIRILLIPAIIVFCTYNLFSGDDVYADWINRVIAFGLFAIAAVTDFLDGHIARKHNLVTDFGKFMDPLADKFLVLGCLFAISFSDYVFMPNTYPDGVCPPEVLRQMFFWASVIVLFRELAVTSMRLVVAKRGVVVPANMLGKIKTNAQMICIMAVLVEPLIFPFFRGWFSAFCIVGMTVFTIWSGISYIVSYWKYLDVSI